MDKPNLNPKSLANSLFVKRHKARQALGILLLVLIAVVSEPTLPGLYIAGAVIGSAGIVFRLWAAGYLKKDKELAQDGPYALVRHPLYVGNALIFIGYLAAGQLLWMLPVAILFAAFYYPPAIRQEDAKLRKLFGEQWDRWYAETWALLPKWPTRPLNITHWSFNQSLRANGEPVIAAALVLGLVVMGMRVL